MWNNPLTCSGQLQFCLMEFLNSAASHRHEMENVEGGDAVLHAGTGAPPSNPLEAGEEVNPAAERKL